MLFYEEALDKIYVLKDRAQTKQIPRLLSSIEEAKETAFISRQTGIKLMIENDLHEWMPDMTHL